jgi:hypothetical protein
MSLSQGTKKWTRVLQQLLPHGKAWTKQWDESPIEDIPVVGDFSNSEPDNWVNGAYHVTLTDLSSGAPDAWQWSSNDPTNVDFSATAQTQNPEFIYRGTLGVGYLVDVTLTPYRGGVAGTPVTKTIGYIIK